MIASSEVLNTKQPFLAGVSVRFSVVFYTSGTAVFGMFHRRKLVVTTAALLLMSAAPALATSCCGGRGKAGMCVKGNMAMNMKGKKGGGCCEGMGSNMTKRSEAYRVRTLGRAKRPAFFMPDPIRALIALDGKVLGESGPAAAVPMGVTHQGLLGVSCRAGHARGR